MPRQLRIEYAGAIYHVMNRGDRREPIFHDDLDRKRFVAALGEACTKTDWQMHAYCLMLRRDGKRRKKRRGGFLQEELDKLGWTAKDLAARSKSDIRKMRLARRLWTETSVTWKWISAELHLGTWTHAASQVAKLKTEPKEQNEFRLE